ncbi:hypothetical protein KIPB_003254 [Kipferlia bialata]|uniref:Uncharacterized protein n=1 Tax=Kipferlia bialata TaxID=797122 RepID=A0A391NJW9_9EUKA|nr:hypothetical protein KIPB_003254 [Kipferlia bialata]|eukprot:g3254.t1
MLHDSEQLALLDRLSHDRQDVEFLSVASVLRQRASGSLLLGIVLRESVFIEQHYRHDHTLRQRAQQGAMHLYTALLSVHKACPCPQRLLQACYLVTRLCPPSPAVISLGLSLSLSAPCQHPEAAVFFAR